MGRLTLIDAPSALADWLASAPWPVAVDVSVIGPDDPPGDWVVWRMDAHPRPLEAVLARRADATIVVWDAPPDAETQLAALRLGAADAIALGDREGLERAIARLMARSARARAEEAMLQQLLERSYSQSVLNEVLVGIPGAMSHPELYEAAVRPLWEWAGADWGQLVLASDGSACGDGPPLASAPAPGPDGRVTVGDGFVAHFELSIGGDRVGTLRFGGATERLGRLEGVEPVIRAAAGPIALAVAHLHHLEAAQRAAIRDGLTGLANHAHFQSRLRAEHDRAVRYGQGFAVMMIDLDHFKAINDGFGHPTGDRALKAVADALAAALRQSDLPARYGGEEFVALLPATGVEGAFALAERLRRTVATLVVEGPDGRPIGPVTASIGIAAFEPGESPQEVTARADAALYIAKATGRNRTHVAGSALACVAI